MKPENKNLILDLRHTLHEHAELSNYERCTMALLIRFIREHSTAQIVEKDGWFYAWRPGRSGCRNLAFRADMDAVAVDETIDLPYGSRTPGVSHKCGHDGHMAALVGLILETEDLTFDPNLYFLFQPAEETGEGGSRCQDFVPECRIDEIYGFHNIPGVAQGTALLLRETFACASRGLVLSFEGATSHAAYPQFGRNPAYAIADVIRQLPAIADPADYQGLILCTIIQVNVGERAFGVSAGHGELLLTIRAEREEELDRLHESVLAACQASAARDQLTFSCEVCDAFPETRNHPTCTAKVQRACEDLGIPYHYPAEPMRWSEDFGYFLKQTKGAFFGIGDGETHPQLHREDYDFNDDILETVVSLFRAILLENTEC